MLFRSAPLVGGPFQNRRVICARETNVLNTDDIKLRVSAKEPSDNRHRRLHTLGRMVEGVMILDPVLGDRRCWWLNPECDKRVFFDLTQQTGLGPEDYPHIAFGAGRAR